jgi:hypothetical protein
MAKDDDGVCLNRHILIGALHFARLLFSIQFSEVGLSRSTRFHEVIKLNLQLENHAWRNKISVTPFKCPERPSDRCWGSKEGWEWLRLMCGEGYPEACWYKRPRPDPVQEETGKDQELKGILGQVHFRSHIPVNMLTPS